MAQQAEALSAGGVVTALVLRTDQENTEYIRTRFGALRAARARRRGYYAAAYQRGHERGEDVSLSPRKGLRHG
jgi:hypothetical protein